MMGRLQTWIDRLALSRRRGSVGVALARRRPLSFELCESRLALSAAAQTSVTDGDTIHYVELMSDLWARTPGSADWTQVSFGVVRDPVATQASVPIDLTINPGPFAPLPDLTEGGLIAFTAAGDGVLRNVIVNRQSNAIVDAAFGRFNAAQINDATASFLGADWGPVTQGESLLSSDVDSTQSWDFQPTDVPDLLGETESTSPMAEGGALTTTPPILRITAPLNPTRDEGGRIDLTAMAGPTNLDRHSSLGTSATYPIAPRLAARTADDLPAAASDQNLRARAVVYQVAYERDGERTPAPEELGSTLDHASTRAQGSDDSSPVRDAVPLARRDADAPIVVPTRGNILKADDDNDEPSALAAPDASDSAQADVASRRDAVLAIWGDDFRPEDSLAEGDAEGGLALTDARQRNVGLAIALAVTAAPLARRYRRSRQAHTAERNAGLS